MLLDDPLDLLQVSAQQVTGDGVLKCTDGITVFQCPLVLAGMCQQSIEDTGDISVTASDTVYDFDIGVRSLFIMLLASPSFRKVRRAVSSEQKKMST